MLLNNQELFHQVREIADRLSAVGEQEKASRLREAMVSSTVPGEILGELRLELDRLGHESQDNSEFVDDVLKYLNTVLG